MMRIEQYVNGHTRPAANLDTIFAELAALRVENRALRARLPKTRRYSATTRRAVTDAHTLLCNAFSGDATGRLAMEAEGMSKRRWAWAVALLRYAGIVSFRQKQWRNGLEFVVTELAESIRLLETAAREIDTGEGYKRLRTLLRKV